MLWRRVTVVLVAACVALPAWAYLRDRDDALVRQPQLAQAQLDADRMLTSLSSSPGCSTACTAQVLGRIGSTTWRVRLVLPGWRQCFAVDVRSFGQTAAHGFTGLRSAGCRA